MSQLNVDNIRNRTGSNGGPNFPSGITVAVGQTAYIHGNLQVDGTETIINTETLNVADKTVGIGSTSNASNTTADGSGIEIFASSSQTGNNKTITWSNTANSWEFGPNDVGLKVGVGVTIYGETGIVSATSFKGDGSLLTGIDATAIQTGNTSVQTVDTGSDGHVKMTTEGGERVRVGPAGQIGLGGANYGTSGQVITSAGSGSAPTWSAIPAAGNTFTGIASGSMANDRAAMICQDGKIAQIKTTLTALDPFTNNGAQTQMGGFYNGTHFDICYDPANDGVWVAYPAGNASNRLDVSFYKVQASVAGYSDWIHSSSYVEVTVDSTTSCESPKLVYDPDTQRTIICWRKGGTEAFDAKVLQYNSNNTITQGSIVTLLSSGCLQPSAIYDTTNNKVILGCVNSGSSNRYETWVCTITGGSTNSLSAGTATNNAGVTGTTENRFPTMLWDPDNEKVVLYTRCNGGGYSTTGVICVGTYSSGTGTLVWDTSTNIGDNQYAGTIVYDTNRNKFVVLYANGSASYNRYTRVVTVSGTTVTVGANQGKVNSLGRNQTDNENHTMSFDPITNKIIFYFYDEDDSRLYFNSGEIDSNGTTTTIGTHITITTQQYRQNGFPGMAGTYTKNGQHLFVAKCSSDNNQVYVKNVRSATNAPNLHDGHDYIGYPDQAYTDGQTVTIKTIGNNVDTLSGLSPATNYFVQADGTIATTADGSLSAALGANVPFAGIAISPTKLLIRDPWTLK